MYPISLLTFSALFLFFAALNAPQAGDCPPAVLFMLHTNRKSAKKLGNQHN